jgi:methionyl-tRNA formyltransferase
MVAPLRIVFFGTPDFAVPTLEALRSSSHPVISVVTQPDRPKGRGQRLTEGSVKAHAQASGITVLQPASLKNPVFLDALSALQPDLGVVAAYGKILSEAVLRIPRLGMINVHASLLPKYRGAAPIHRAVAAGEPETGVTIMRVVKALDAGPMLATVHRPIGPDDTSVEVENDLAHLGARLLVEVVDGLSAGPVNEEPQDDRLATYAHRLTKEDGLIDWTQPAQVVHDLVRGMQPWPNAYSFLNGQRLILLRSSVDAASYTAAPGTVLLARSQDLLIAAGRGAIRVQELQPEGRRPMGVAPFLAGHAVTPGARFASSG